ncbi:MAG: hypothetical protein AAF700_15835 [Pseudomonadota bacterium]
MAVGTCGIEGQVKVVIGFTEGRDEQQDRIGHDGIRPDLDPETSAKPHALVSGATALLVLLNAHDAFLAKRRVRRL